MALDIDLSELALGSFDSRTRLHRLEGDGALLEILFSTYTAHAARRWADDIADHLQASANAGVRSTTTQYRETDFAFMLADRGKLSP